MFCYNVVSSVVGVVDAVESCGTEKSVSVIFTDVEGGGGVTEN